MRKTAPCLFTLLLFFLARQWGMGQSFSGNDFWVTVTQPRFSSGHGDTDIVNAYLVVSGESGTQVKFYRVHSKLRDSLIIPARGMDTFRIRYATHITPVVYSTADVHLKYNQLYDRTLHVAASSNIDVKLYLEMPEEQFSKSASQYSKSFTYPRFFGTDDELGCNPSFQAIRAFKGNNLSYTSINGSAEYEYSDLPTFTSNGVFIVVAAEDSTKVEITPKTDLLGGYSAKTPFIKWLNKGELFYAGTDDSDMTGSTLRVLNCKPVSVFTGGNVTPRELIWKKRYGKLIYPWVDGTGGVYTHHFMPLLPDQVYGYRYLIPYDPIAKDSLAKAFNVGAPVPNFCPGPLPFDNSCPPQKGYATVQCVALFDNTKVKVNNRVFTLAKKGDTNGDSTQNCGYVEADKPISVVWMPGGIRGAGSFMLPAFNVDTLVKDTLYLPCAWVRSNTGYYRPWRSAVAWVMAPGPGNPTVWINGRRKQLQRPINKISEEWYFDTLNLIDNFNNKLYCSRGAFGIYAYEFNGQDVQNIYPFGINTTVQWQKMKVNGLWNMRFDNLVQVCQSTPAVLEGITDWYVPRSAKWILPKGFKDSGSKISYTFPDTGLMKVVYITQRKDLDCNNQYITDTLEKYVHVYSLPVLHLPSDTTICKGTLFKIKSWRSELPKPVWNLNKTVFCNACDSILPQIDSAVLFEATISKTGCKMVRDSINIGVYDSLQMQLTGDTVRCYGQQATFHLYTSKIPTYDSIQWNIPSQNDTIAFIKAIKNSKILVKIKDVCASSNRSDSLYVKVYPPLKLINIKDTSLCYQASYLSGFKVHGGNPDSVAHTWWNGKKDAVANYAVVSDSSFLVLARDGCSIADSARMIIKSYPLLKTTWFSKQDTWCYEKPLPFRGAAQGGDSTHYGWELKLQNLTLEKDSGFVWTPTFPLTKNGAYTLSMTNRCGVKDTQINSLFVRSNKLNISNSEDTVCSNVDTIWGTVNGKYSKVYIKYANKVDSVQTSGAFNFILKPSFAGRILIIANDGCGIPDTSFVTRWLATPLNIKVLSQLAYCAPAQVSLHFAAQGGVSHKTNYSITSYGLTSNVDSLLYLADTSHKAYFEAEDGCTIARDTEYIEIVPVINGNWKDTLGCKPLGINVTLPRLKDKLLWKVDMGDGSAIMWSQADDVNAGILKATMATPGIFTARIWLVSGNLECLEGTFKVSVLEMPKANFTYFPSSIDITEPLVQFDNLSQFATNYRWYFGDGNGDVVLNPKHTFGDTGLYSIKLVASNSGCADSISKTLHVYGRLMVFIPNAINPQGINTSFTPKVYNGILERIEIYNRWGAKLHDSPMPYRPENGDVEEILMYIVYVKDYNGKQYTFNGTIHVLH